MATINRNDIKRAASGAITKKLKEEAERMARTQVRKANQELISNFLRHRISIELMNGPDGPGSLPDGNLFSFLGFYDGDNPVAEVASALANSIKIESIRANRQTMTVRITLKLPSIEDFDGNAQLPWINKSWLRAVEDGISGLGRYLYEEEGFEASRSGTGVQAQKTVRGGSWGGKPYLTQIVEKIAKKLAKDIRSKSV